jgi:tripartite-type tricarboxylate transporter receptor subunit TctC
MEQAGKAESYPTRPVKIIAPYPPGGGIDAVARILAQRLAQRMGGQFYVENLPGAGGTIGTGKAATAAADGHTLLVFNQDFVVQPILKAKVPYDPFKSFAPITLMATAPEMVVVHPSLPAKDMRELIALLKANPGKYSYASPGYGTSPHLACERLFKLALDLDVVHVPFQGGAPAVASTLAGHTAILHISAPLVAPHVKAGTLRALAVASSKRSPAFPDVPTLAEAGVPDHEVEYWSGIAAPADTPKSIVDLLRREIADVVGLNETKERLASLGLEPIANTPEELAAYIKAESAKWSTVVLRARVKID